jgi:hypothetical protein
MSSSLILPRVVFYPCIAIFAITCWYIGYSQGQSAIPIGFEVVELPACMPEPEAQASYL